MSSHEVFATASELLDLPHKRRLVWGILHAPRRCLTNVNGELSMVASSR